MLYTEMVSLDLTGWRLWWFLLVGKECDIGEWYLSSLLRDEKEEQHGQKQERMRKCCLISITTVRGSAR